MGATWHDSMNLCALPLRDKLKSIYILSLPWLKSSGSEQKDRLTTALTAEPPSAL